jgi:uracil-DNA glycosylase family 4
MASFVAGDPAASGEAGMAAKRLLKSGTDAARNLSDLQHQVMACTRCSRLISYCRKVAKEKRRMYRDREYWGKPVPSFGDANAQLLILGLAPAAHGGNRTGRMFTGDRSGDFLYRGLYAAGFANQPTSLDRDDGLDLRNCYITASLRCAPPLNKPQPQELRNCQPYLRRELELLRGVRAVLVLGRIAFDAYLRVLAQREGFPPRSTFRFAHGASFTLPDGLPRLFCSYHPSQQNTQTGRLTPAMFQQVLGDIRDFLTS